MKHRKPEFKIDSYGEYSPWDKTTKELPKILDIGTDIYAQIGTEFGYILKIKKGKGEKLSFKIEHPAFEDENGIFMPPFMGEHYIKTNDYQFFLGDNIWEPIDNKLGQWILTIYHNSKIVATKTFTIHKKEG